MRRSLVFGVLVLVLACGNGAWGTVLHDKGASNFVLQDYVKPFSSENHIKQFAGNERACAIVIGDGNTYLGLYVYDNQGNCVAWDDHNHIPARDDVAVEWTPQRTEPFTLEIQNFGLHLNRFELAGK